MGNGEKGGKFRVDMPPSVAQSHPEDQALQYRIQPFDSKERDDTGQKRIS